MLRTIAALVLAVFFAINSYGDVVFDMDQKEPGTGTTGRSEGKVKGQNIRLDYYKAGDVPEGSMVFSGDQGKLIMINHEDKSYIVLDEAAMEALGSRMDQVMSQMEEALKDVPPEKREMVKKMMKERMPGMAGGEVQEPQIKKVGSAKVGDYTCTKYDVYKGEVKIMQHCVAPWSKIDGGDEMKSAMLGMGDFMDKMAERFSSSSSIAGPGVQNERNMFKQLRKLDGFPVQTIIYAQDEEVGESNLVSSKEETVDPSVFEPPPGYSLQTFDMGQ